MLLLLPLLFKIVTYTYAKSSTHRESHVDIISAPYYAPFFNSINGIVTFNTTEYISLVCNQSSPIYSETDCLKVNADEQRLLRKLMK